MLMGAIFLYTSLRKDEERDRPRKLAPIVVESPKPPRRGLERKAGRQMKNE